VKSVLDQSQTKDVCEDFREIFENPHIQQHDLQLSIERVYDEEQSVCPSENKVEEIFATHFLTSRKITGAFFTPPKVVALVLDELGFPAFRGGKAPTLLDLSCGTGHFLRGGMERIARAYIQRGLPPEQAACRAVRAIEGVEVNPIARNVARYQLLADLRPFFASDDAFQTNLPDLRIHLGDCLIAHPSESFLCEHSYDFIVLNPPYVAQKGEKNAPKIAPAYAQMLKNQYWTLNPQIYRDQWGIYVPGHLKINLLVPFIELGIRLLSPGGRLGVVVHKNLLDVGSYWPLRHLILNRCQIKEIVDLTNAGFPDVTGETVIIILENAVSNSSVDEITTKINQFHTPAGKNAERGSGFQIRQSHFRFNFQESFLIYLREEHYRLKERIWEFAGGIPLGDLAEISSFGINVPPEYEGTGTQHPDWAPAIRGRDIGRYRLLNESRVINFTPEVLSRRGQFGLFASPLKIIMQRIGPRLQGCLDFEQRVCFNSTNVIVPHSCDVTYAKYLLAVLNSSLLDAYYKLFLSNQNVLTVNVTQAKLGILPIVIPDKVTMQEIASLIDQVLGNSEQQNSHFQEISQDIDQKILNAYQITQEGLDLLQCKPFISKNGA